MATRILRDPALIRRLDATLELARDVLDDHGVHILIAAAESAMTAQADREDEAPSRPWLFAVSA